MYSLSGQILLENNSSLVKRFIEEQYASVDTLHHNHHIEIVDALSLQKINMQIQKTPT